MNGAAGSRQTPLIHTSACRSHQLSGIGKCDVTFRMVRRTPALSAVCKSRPLCSVGGTTLGISVSPPDSRPPQLPPAELLRLLPLPSKLPGALPWQRCIGPPPPSILD
ncbi:hypothetical protein NDU88_003454 [Pleurodeles waltl]|uniref:Uncharacterized protein n=1 Tax=Pleurodeles waltl TaxID=8319 RepID=A0AAV7M5F1_PLEWA|nr:hypothetical protein NDU88_003454 [Pleurodeles waltl]